MRHPQQILERQRRVSLANDLLVWLPERGYRIFWTFVRYRAVVSTGVDMFDLWRAWAILIEAKKVLTHRGGHWRVIDRKAVIADEFGDITQPLATMNNMMAL